MSKINFKKKSFQILLFFLPIIIIVLLETGLKIFSFFSPEPLFINISEQGKEYYQLNPYVAKRYFKATDKIIPTLYPEKFEKYKSTNTFRIFALGGSTTAGFPFDYQVPFPQQLKYLLSEKYPKYNFEIINLGLSAVNSFTVLDFIPEVLEKNPDMILIYMGHNEFYGVYGSASSYFIGENGNFIRFYLNLQKLHLTQMLKSIIAAITPKVESTEKNLTLMEKMIKDKKVEYNSDKYKNTLNNFEDNLKIILDEIDKNEIPVIVSNLVSNIKDLRPFSFKDNLLNNSKFNIDLNLSDSTIINKDSKQKLNDYINILNSDSLNAFIHYNIAQLYLNNNDTIKAKIHFLKAKDLDFVRFRASEDLSEIIEKTTKHHRNNFLNMELLFSENSQFGIIGDELICDHLHPNPDGYYLMAIGFYKIIEQLELLKSENSGFIINDKPYFVTDLDWNIGLLKVYKLKHGWPFDDKKINYLNFKPMGNSKNGVVAYDYIFKHQNWTKAHEEMAAYFSQQNKVDKEREEFEAISNTFPENFKYSLKVASIYKLSAHWKKAEKYFYQALPFSSNKGSILFDIGQCQWKQRKLDAALQSLKSASIQEDITEKSAQKINYYLAGILAEADSIPQAINIVKGIIDKDSKFKPAKILLQQLQDYIKN